MSAGSMKLLSSLVGRLNMFFAVVAKTKGVKSQQVLVSVFASSEDADNSVTQLLSVKAYTKFESVKVVPCSMLTLGKNGSFTLSDENGDIRL